MEQIAPLTYVITSATVLSDGRLMSSPVQLVRYC